MATITDVSKRAGVSRSTVSRVIAESGYVSENARKSVERAIAELGYRPNTMARGLRSNRSNMIGCVVVDVASPFYAQLMGGGQDACRAAGRSMLVSSGFANQADEAHAIIELLDRSCDGLVLCLESTVRPDVLEIIRRSAVPVVVIGGDECEAASGIMRLDNFAGGRLGMEHLLEAGHRDIVHLTGGLAFRDTRERLRGIEAALAPYGLSIDDITVIHGQFSEKSGYAATMRLLDRGVPVTAIFAGDDEIAAGAMVALKHAGLRLPQDVSIVGFDDNFHARHLSPALTTIRQPIDTAAELAVEMLLTILEGRRLERTEIVIPTELVRRESVAAAPPRTLEGRTTGR